LRFPFPIRRRVVGSFSLVNKITDDGFSDIILSKVRLGFSHLSSIVVRETSIDPCGKYLTEFYNEYSEIDYVKQTGFVIRFFSVERDLDRKNAQGKNINRLQKLKEKK